MAQQVKEAGMMVALEATKFAAEMLFPAGSGFAKTDKNLDELTKKINFLLDSHYKCAVSLLKEGMISLQSENFEDAFTAFKKTADKTRDAFFTTTEDLKHINMTRIKNLCTVFTKCYDKTNKCFLKYEELPEEKKREIGVLMEKDVQLLLENLPMLEKMLKRRNLFFKLANEILFYQIMGDLHSCLSSGKHKFFRRTLRAIDSRY